MQLWPVVEFVCGVCLITYLYVLMLCHNLLPFTAIFGLCILEISLTLMCCLLFDMASMSTIKSARILKLVKSSDTSKHTRKFLRSCTPIIFRVAEFHKIDRDRYPSFLRFVLYQTFALVVKTKLSADFGSRIVVQLPNSFDIL